MCLVIVYRDPSSNFPIRLFETRDEYVFRPHGWQAIWSRRGVRTASFAEHWLTPDSLDDLFLVHDDPAPILAARAVGGFDLHGGTWLAVSQRHGVYARLLTGLFDDGSYGDSATPECEPEWAKLGYVHRGGLCLDAVSFGSAREAAELMPARLREQLRRRRVRLLPHILVVADARDVFVLRADQRSEVIVTEIPPRELTMVSIFGVSSEQSGITCELQPLFRQAPLPDPAEPDGWDSWITLAAVQTHFDDAWAREGALPYHDPAWRSHIYSVIQPPYLNVDGDLKHCRPTDPIPAAGQRVEWTCSATCFAADQDGRLWLLSNERHLAPEARIPINIGDGSYPRSTRDFQPAQLQAER